MKPALLVLPVLPVLIAGLMPVAADAADGRTLPIARFSDRYRAEVHVGANGQEIRVYDQTQRDPVIRMSSELPDADLDTAGADSALPANVRERPYGRQSLLHYQDVDLDGHSDFILKDGNYSCYGGPSYQVFIAQADGSFRRHGDYTRLAQENCGLFSIDPARRTIGTMAKSGCCWHQYDTYAIVNRDPVLVRREERSFPAATRLYRQITVSTPARRAATRTGAAPVPMHTQTRFHLPADPDTGASGAELFSFALQGGKRRVHLLAEDDFVDYALTITPADHEEGEYVEFSYLLHSRSGQDDEARPAPLTYDADAHSVTFSNAGTRYTVVDAPGRFGVEVRTRDGRTVFLPGDHSSRRGSMAAVARHLGHADRSDK